MKAGTGIAIGFVLLLALIVVYVFLSYRAFGVLIRDSAVMGNSGDLAAEISRGRIEVHSWNTGLSALLMGDPDAGPVAADPRDCSFGRWLHGQGRKQAQDRFPALATLFKDMEKPHAEMHAAAARIIHALQQEKMVIPDLLARVIEEQQQWKDRIRDAFLAGSMDTLDGLPVNPTACTLGQWLYSDDTRSLIQEHPELARHLRELEPLHNRLHGSISDISKFMISGDRLGAVAYYKRTAEPVFRQTAGKLQEIINRQADTASSLNEAEMIYNSVVLPSLRQVQEFLAQAESVVRKETAGGGFTARAARTRQQLGLFGLLAVGAGALIALIAAMSIPAARAGAAHTPLPAAGKSPRTSVRPGDEKTGSPPAMSGDLGSVLSMTRNTFSELSGSARQVHSTSAELETLLEEQAANAGERENLTTQLQERLREMLKPAAETGEDAQAHHAIFGRLNRDANNLADMAASIRSRLERSPEPLPVAAAGQPGLTAGLAPRLSEITSTLSETAEQANLLSVNASIEAARAGSRGKGFSLIADELGAVAERFAGAARDIAELHQAVKPVPAAQPENVTGEEETAPQTPVVDRFQEPVENLAGKAADAKALLLVLNTVMENIAADLHSLGSRAEAEKKLADRGAAHSRSITQTMESLTEQITACAELLGQQTDDPLDTPPAIGDSGPPPAREPGKDPLPASERRTAARGDRDDDVKKKMKKAMAKYGRKR
jgi:methyl-accepting chemotaxis protein